MHIYISRKFALVPVFLIALFAVTFAPAHINVAHAQDDAPVACDSTLATLLLVAEHDYDYLSSMMDTEMGAPNIDLGQYTPLVNDISMMMMDMMDNMSEDDMMAMDEMNAMMEPMMGMSSVDMLAAYQEAMGMEMMDDNMTVLEPGNVAGENELCATVRADVENFILAHIIASTESMMMEEN